MEIRFEPAALLRLDDITRYTKETWGAEQARRYADGLFAAVEGVVDSTTASRPIPAQFGMQGFYFRYEHHYVYWRRLRNGQIGIVTILHERMHQLDRFRDDTRH